MSKVEQTPPVPESKWKWFGFSGHFICGEWCRFHLCTKVGKYLVSTVGRYVPLSVSKNEGTEGEWLKDNPNGQEIGLDRFYETMVFRCGALCRSKECGCGMPELLDSSDLDFKGYNNAGDATRGHRAMCKKWAKRQDRKEK